LTGLELYIEYADVEKELVKKALKGDKEAIAELIAKYQDWIYHLAFRIVKNTEDARDIVQEVALKIITSLSTLQEESKLTSWIYRVTYHLSLNWLRMTKKIRQLDEQELNNAAKPDFPPGTLEREEDLLRLNNALKELPAPYQLIISLYYFDERPYQEIAEMLKIPIGTVKTQLHRAKMMLKERVESGL